MTSSVDFFAYLEKNTYAMLTKEQIAEAEARERRQRAVEGGNWPILSADKTAIVEGTLRFGDESRSALASCRRWYALPEDKRGVFLVMLGTYGLGKTVAACALLADHGGYFVDAPELVRLRWSRNDRDQDQYQKIERARFVVLDDLGTEALDEHGFSTFSQFINRRRSGCKTIITGNFLTPVFTERYGERARGRVEQVGHIVELEGRDLRKGLVSV